MLDEGEELGVVPPVTLRSEPRDGDREEPFALVVVVTGELELRGAGRDDRAEAFRLDREARFLEHLARGRDLDRLAGLDTAARGHPPGVELRTARIAALDEQHRPIREEQGTSGRPVFQHGFLTNRNANGGIVFGSRADQTGRV